MQAFLFYLAYPLIYLVALLPFGALYRVSDFLFHVLRITGYRREVILENLRNSFPGKSSEEIGKLADSYYRYLSDLVLETLKTLTMTEQEARDHCHFHKPEWLDRLYREKRSIILIMGHHGNWEWAGPSFTLNTSYQLVVIYRPLTHPYFEKMMVRMRTKFGTKITPVNQTLRDMVAMRGVTTATAFIADQAAPADKSYWTNFLNQDTSVFTGPEKLAIKFDYPIVYINVKRIKRGVYEVFPELLFEEPKKTAENDISEAFMKRLEEGIQEEPAIWLWSHRRWKNKRTAN